MSGIPDYFIETIVHAKFTTRAFANGQPATLAGTPAVVVYANDNAVEILAGITLTVDFDGKTGLNHLAIDASAANGYAVGTAYQAVISAGDVAGTSVVGEVVAQFSLECSAALRPTVSKRQLNVDANGALAAVATDAIAALSLAAGACNKIADHVLRRSSALAAASSDGDPVIFRSLLGAVRKLTNRVFVTPTLLTVTTEDDTTAAGTQAVTTDPAANPITELNTN